MSGEGKIFVLVKIENCNSHPVEVVDPSSTIENRLLSSISPFFWSFLASCSSLCFGLPACLFLEPAPQKKNIFYFFIFIFILNLLMRDMENL
jgi:hypothetical protein